MESTLNLPLADLKSDVGFFLGWGRGADKGDRAWNSREEAALAAYISSGLRQFYFPEPEEGSNSSYDWSFLRPVASITLPDGDNSVRLPEDFGGLIGILTIQGTGSQSFWEIRLTSEEMVRKEFARIPSASGLPLMAAIRPLKGTTKEHSNRFELFIFPTADQDLTVQFQYYLRPDALTVQHPYWYGGVEHAETVLESCLSIAEQRGDDSMTVHTKKFASRLKASIGMDRKKKPEVAGYNRDRSDLASNWDNYSRRYGGIAVNGIVY